MPMYRKSARKRPEDFRLDFVRWCQMVNDFHSNTGQKAFFSSLLDMLGATMVHDSCGGQQTAECPAIRIRKRFWSASLGSEAATSICGDRSCIGWISRPSRPPREKAAAVEPTGLLLRSRVRGGGSIGSALPNATLLAYFDRSAEGSRKGLMIVDGEGRACRGCPVLVVSRERTGETAYGSTQHGQEKRMPARSGPASLRVLFQQRRDEAAAYAGVPPLRPGRIAPAV